MRPVRISNIEYVQVDQVQSHGEHVQFTLEGFMDLLACQLDLQQD